MSGRTGRFVVLLRGVNVGAHNRISMASLREVLESVGCRAVTTYVQSGNAVFEVGQRAQLERRIEAALVDRGSLSVPVIVRSASAMAELLDANPYARRGEDNPRLHVTFLKQAPAVVIGPDELPKGAGRDEFQLRGKDIYLFCAAGYSDSKLSNTFFERKFDRVATTRNWNTVQQLGRLVAE